MNLIWLGFQDSGICNFYHDSRHLVEVSARYAISIDFDKLSVIFDNLSVIFDNNGEKHRRNQTRMRRV